MTTFVSLASSATMLPVLELGKLGKLGFSTLTPELVKARLAYPGVSVSALNPSHATTIDVIKRRYDLELPIPVLAPSQRAPQIQLRPGDELFIVQASLPRLNEGEVHSDATVQSAPISFLRWRLPVDVDVKAPHGVPQSIYAEVVDHAHSIALWQRGQSQLKSVKALNTHFAGEVAEFKASWSAWCSHGGSYEQDICHECDVYLEVADMMYYALCLWYQGDQSEASAWRHVTRYANENIDINRAIDIMLAKYARRAAGEPKDVDVERGLAAAILG